MHFLYMVLFRSGLCLGPFFNFIVAHFWVQERVQNTLKCYSLIFFEKFENLKKLRDFEVQGMFFFSSKSYKNIKTYLLYEWNKLCSYCCCCCYYIYYYNILLIFFNNPTLKFLTFLVSALEWAKHWGWKVTRERVFNRKVLIKCYCFRQEENHFRNFALSIRALQSPKYRFQSFITFP